MPIGDSLTDPRSHGGGYLEYVRSRCPGIEIDNFGKGATMVNQMRRSYDVQVVASGKHYTHLIVFGGVNDLYSDLTAVRTPAKIEAERRGQFFRDSYAADGSSRAQLLHHDFARPRIGDAELQRRTPPPLRGHARPKRGSSRARAEGCTRVGERSACVSRCSRTSAVTRRLGRDHLRGSMLSDTGLASRAVRAPLRGESREN